MTLKEAMEIVDREARYGVDSRCHRLRKDITIGITDREEQHKHMSKVYKALSTISTATEALENLQFHLKHGYRK